MTTLGLIKMTTLLQEVTNLIIQLVRIVLKVLSDYLYNGVEFF